MRIFKIAIPNDDHHSDIVEVLKTFHCTKLLSFHLESKGSIVDGIFSYKTAVIKKLEAIYERLEQYRRCDTAFNQSLLSLKTAHSFKNGQLRCKSPVRKRVFSLVSNVVNENYTQGQELGLRPPLLREAHTCKKRKMKSRLTALANTQSAQLSVPSYSVSVQPVSEISLSKKRSRWDDGDCVCKPNCSCIQNGVMFFQNENGNCRGGATCKCKYVHC